MAQVPRWQGRGRLPLMSPPRVPAGGAGMAEAGRALVQGSEQVFRLHEQRQKADRIIALTKAETDAELEAELAADPDYASAPDRYDERVAEMRERLMESLPDHELTRAKFAAEFGRSAAKGRIALQREVAGRRQDAAEASLDQLIWQRTRDAAANPERRAEILAPVADAITELRDAGVITAVDAGDRWRDVLAQTDEVAALQALQNNPAAAADMLADPRQFPALDPERRQSLIRTAETRATRYARKADAAAARYLEGLEDRVEREMYARHYDGSLDEEFLELARPHLSPRAYNTGLRLVHDGDPPSSHAETLRDLEVRLGEPGLGAEIQEAYSSLRLTTEDYRSLVARQRNLLQSEVGNPMAVARRYVRGKLGAGEGFGEVAAKVAQSVEADAQAELELWANELRQREGRAPTLSEALEKSRDLARRGMQLQVEEMANGMLLPPYYEGRRHDIDRQTLQGLRAAYYAARHVDETMTEGDYRRALETIEQWDAYLDRNEEADDAAHGR